MSKETVSTFDKETVSGLSKETVGKGGTESGARTVASAKGMTPEELIEARGLKNGVYHNNTFQNIGMEVEEGQKVNNNTRYIMKNLRIANLPDIDLMNADQVRDRINEYFSIEAEYGNKPTVSGLGMALNAMDRRRLWEIVTGNTSPGHYMGETLPKTVRDLIKKAYKLLAQLWEDYMQNGQINPVSGIFLGKNNYGYQDKTEYVVTPNTRQESDFSEADIRARLGLPPTDSKSDSGSDYQIDSD